MYQIPCSCGNVYIGETKRALETRIKEHRAAVRWGETDEEWIFTISNLLLRLPHSIGNIASWMMFKLTNLLTVFIIQPHQSRERSQPGIMYWCGLFPLCQFPLCQFPLCQFPLCQLPTSSPSHFVNSRLVNIDQVGIDKVGIDKVGS